MSTNTKRNLIVIGGMAVVIGGGAVIFAIRAPPSATVAQAVVPPPAQPELAATVPDTRATVAPATPAPAPQAEQPAPQPPPVAATRKPLQAGMLSTRSSAVAPPLPMDPAATTAGAPPPRASSPPPAPMDPSPIPVAAPDMAAGPAPPNPDARITNDVQSSIAGVLPGGEAHVGVATHGGVVVLTGNLPSQQAIDQVTAVAGLVQDVRSVDASALVLAGQ